MRVKLWSIWLLSLSIAIACREPERITRADAEDLVRATFADREPVYAEVPLAVRWSPESPLDEFDRLSIASLEGLQRAGLVRLQRSGDGARGEVEATVTIEGSRMLGAVPSARGPAVRGRIAERRLDGVGRVDLHPADPTTARVEVLWHYADPTPLYEIFLTRRDKQLNQPYASVVSMGWSEGAWRGRVIVRKTRPTSPAG